MKGFAQINSPFLTLLQECEATVQCPSPLKKLRVWRDTTGGLMSSSQITNSQVKGRWLMYRNCLRRAYKYIATLNRKKLPKNYSIQLTHCYNLTISSRQSLERKTVGSMPKIERDPSLKSVCKPLVLKLWHWSLSTVLKRGEREKRGGKREQYLKLNYFRRGHLVT